MPNRLYNKQVSPKGYKTGGRVGLHKGGIPRKVEKVPKKEKIKSYPVALGSGFKKVKNYPTAPTPKRKYPERKQISVKEEIERRMKEETPRTYKIAKGKLGMLRKHLHKKRIKKELESRPEHLSKPKVKKDG